MLIDIQFKIKSNPNFINYLHTHSYWYKILNRDPSKINDFIYEAKSFYGLRTTDKINKALNTFEMFSSIISTLK